MLIKLYVAWLALFRPKILIILWQCSACVRIEERLTYCSVDKHRTADTTLPLITSFSCTLHQRTDTDQRLVPTADTVDWNQLNESQVQAETITDFSTLFRFRFRYCYSKKINPVSEYINASRQGEDGEHCWRRAYPRSQLARETYKTKPNFASRTTDRRRVRRPPGRHLHQQRVDSPVIQACSGG